MIKRIEDLEVYMMAEAFADEVWSLVSGWDYFTKDTIGKQLACAADSIGANIAEGFGRYHYKENKNFCYFSRGSVIETKSWLRKCINRKLLNENEAPIFLSKLEAIHIKLNAYIKSIGK